VSDNGVDEKWSTVTGVWSRMKLTSERFASQQRTDHSTSGTLCTCTLYKPALCNISW